MFELRVPVYVSGHVGAGGRNFPVIGLAILQRALHQYFGHTFAFQFRVNFSVVKVQMVVGLFFVFYHALRALRVHYKLVIGFVVGKSDRFGIHGEKIKGSEVGSWISAYGGKRFRGLKQVGLVFSLKNKSLLREPEQAFILITQRSVLRVPLP
jgi:hypothetical protein